ncbi:DNA-3-methyladenine glycosylase family protein [Cryobacterium arcticum]|uniref:DNA-3-methyladenine glycosylase II n=1 Tax=Cryobacterium arcticum TaxID=670052 RepID=A0A318A314_9MICO|nr:DNA-3-methyladenine glycosylase [Cryobacterium arcticum]PXA71767.1 DNA-3-methyladenine glycosylase [Cryobacterium arcticum]
METFHEVLGPWSLATSRRFWEGFAPAALPANETGGHLHTVFLAEADWQRVEATVHQAGDTARISVTGPGDLEAATEQVRRFVSLDIDARDWPAVGRRDPVIAEAQRLLPGLRPCGFHSPYEAAAWSVLSQRIRMSQAARLSSDLTSRLGADGAFPSPQVLRGLTLDLPGRKADYLHAVADAALAGVLDGPSLRALPAGEALEQIQSVHGLGPFAAELVLIRGANAPDVFPHTEGRLSAEIVEKYGAELAPSDVADAWRPFRSWAGVHLRALRELRTHEIERGAAFPR